MKQEIDLRPILMFCTKHRIEFDMLGNLEGESYINYETKPKKKIVLSVGVLETEESIIKFNELLDDKMVELKNLFD